MAEVGLPLLLVDLRQSGLIRHATRLRRPKGLPEEDAQRLKPAQERLHPPSANREPRLARCPQRPSPLLLQSLAAPPPSSPPAWVQGPSQQLEQSRAAVSPLEAVKPPMVAPPSPPPPLVLDEPGSLRLWEAAAPALLHQSSHPPLPLLEKQSPPRRRPLLARSLALAPLPPPPPLPVPAPAYVPKETRAFVLLRCQCATPPPQRRDRSPPPSPPLRCSAVHQRFRSSSSPPRAPLREHRLRLSSETDWGNRGHRASQSEARRGRAHRHGILRVRCAFAGALRSQKSHSMRDRSRLPQPLRRRSASARR
mmetsp:Transcript_6294/g.21104  ORF Transcript_6294/g.21104 Transcript_6294/m.21104 type:complete len:309 (+) Transcript_6294:1088-2014(+)